MPNYEARMRVIHEEVWVVEAPSKEEAREKFNELSDDVIIDTGGEIVDWDLRSIEIIKY